ncbi:hypothetical protein ACER0C_003085 [Sarotherodon galilaeus]
MTVCHERSLKTVFLSCVVSSPADLTIIRAVRGQNVVLPCQCTDPSFCLVIYTLLHVEPGVQNTLICHVTGFYPAPVNITWTKNEQKVTEGTSTSLPFPNKDGSFKQTSRLDLIPKKRDVYSCTVEHMALTQPITKFDEPDV